MKMPYGEGVMSISPPDGAIVVETNDLSPLEAPANAIREALQKPIGSERLSQIARKNDRVTIVIPDITRPGTFRKEVIPLVLEELHRSGVRDEDICILNGPGSHRHNTDAEFRRMMGDEITDRYSVLNHNLYDEETLIELDNSDLGDPVIVNRLIIESDVVIDVGLVQPQPSAGYSSGGKHFSVGVAGAKTIISTHRSFDPAGIWGSTSRMGVWKGNKFRDRHESIATKIQESTKAGVIFSVNCVINSQHKLIGIFAGEMLASFKAAAELADKQWKVDIPSEADLVICAAGHPYDKDIYQVGVAVCALERAPVPAVKEGGVIIFVGPMGEIPHEGTTEQYVMKVLSDAYGPEDVFNIAREFDDKGEIPPLGLQRAFSNCLFEKLVHGHLVMAGAKMPGLTRSVHWTPTRSFEEAYGLGKDILGKNDASILVIPRVRSTIVNIRKSV
jgi:nickel-dependent lactate racemase